jgi:hypothetical protein
VAVFWEFLPSLIVLFEEIERSSDAKSSATASALCNAVKKPSFLVALAVADTLMSYLVSPSHYLQTVNLNISQALASVQAARENFVHLRNEATDAFGNIFEKASKMAEEWDVELAIPRRVGRQTHRDNVEANSPEEYYRRTLFLPFLDFLIKELGSRFGNPPAAYRLQQLLPAFVTTETQEQVMEVARGYMCDLDAPIQVVRAQLDIWLSMMRREEGLDNSLSSCVQKARSCGLDHIVTLLKLFGTIPVTTASAERSFSALKRLKTVLRSTMSEERLN